jgi:glyceraldehyde-3-phosphate dehydrogenase (NADP+)
MLCGNREVIKPIMASGDLNVLAFIGTSKAADAMRTLHPKPHRLRCVLGLEAKNAAIVLEDADLDQAVSEVAKGAFSFNGQRCTAIKIVYVAEAIREKFLAGLSAKVQALNMGLPWQPGVQITPLPEPGKPEYLDGLVRDGLAKGATIVNPGGGVFSRTAYQPTILFGVDESMRVFNEEQFGPVLPVKSFTDLAEPLRYLVESNYGQQVSLFGNDPDQLAALIDPLVNQVSRVNINSQCQRGPDTLPFTGRKDSAEGTLSVHDALRSFSIRALVAANETDANKALIKSILKGGTSKFLSTDFIF